MNTQEHTGRELTTYHSLRHIHSSLKLNNTFDMWYMRYFCVTSKTIALPPNNTKRFVTKRIGYIAFVVYPKILLNSIFFFRNKFTLEEKCISFRRF